VHGRRQAVASGAASAWQAEYRLRRADGAWASVLDRGYLLRNPQGQVARMLGALQDTTARQQWLTQQNADLQQFAYVVSHDVRAPLANALGFGQGFDQQRAGAEIIQLYRRFHTSPGRRGVGLFLVKAHAEAMSGQPCVQSRVDIGIQFTLSFPFSNDEDLFN
jgi:signal transduction histidine kinase